MSIANAAVLSSASKAGRTVSLVLDAYGAGTSTFVYDSTAVVSNGYVARIDPDGTYTPLAGGYGSALGPNPAFSGNATISGTLGITPSSNSQTALTISAPAAGTVDAVDIYVGATKKIWVDNTGQLNALAASVSALTITTSLTLPAPLSLSQGGTGTSSPAFANGSNISITGSFPNHTVGVVASPSFTSLTMNGAVTWPAAGTATSGTNYGSVGGPTLNVSLWNGSAAVAHSWQMLGDSALGNLRFYYDGNLHAALPAAGGLLVKGTDWSTTVVTLGADGTGTFTGALSATALTLSATPLAVTSGGTGTASPAFVNGTGISITGSFPNHTVGLSHGDYADVVNAQTIAGIKTFSSAPVMSGASISASTIADGSLATQYVLTVGASGNLSSSGGRNPSITITATPTFGATTVAALVATTGSFSGAVTSRGLTIQDPTTSTKQAAFAMSSISASTTRTFTFPDVNGTLVTTGDTGSITNAMLAGSIAITKLVASTISGISLGNNLNALTFGTYLTGTSYNGSATVTLGTNAVSTNTFNTLVARDGSGGFSMGTLTAAAATITGTLTHSGGYALLGSYNVGLGVYPTALSGLGVAANFSNGGRDISLWNTDTLATTIGFTFRQLTGASSQTLLATIGTGGITANTGSFVAGSSTYGPSSATVAGALTASYYISNASAGTAQFTFTNNAGGSNQTALFAASSNTSGVTSTALAVYGTGLATPQLLAIDASGNVGALGSFKTGSSIYGPTSATVNGLVTASGGVSSTGSPSGFYNSEFRLGNTPNSGNFGISTADTGAPVMYFDHIGTSNTGAWYWRNGTNASSTRMTLSAGGALVVASTVSATQFIAASSSTIVLSNAGAAAGTGYYFDTVNAAVRCAGSFYFQGASGAGTCSIANVGSITGTGLLALTGVGTHTFGTAGSSAANSVILALGNNQGGSNLAYITTHDATSIAGITGTCLGFGQIGVAALVALDLSGNMGVAGSFYAVSSSKHKTGIREIAFDPVDVIKRTTVKHFNYKTDEAGHEERLGLIADESPVEISGPGQDRHDFMRTIAVLIAANKALIARVEALEAVRA